MTHLKKKSCKVVLHCTKMTLRKAAYFFKEPLPRCFIHLHWVVTVSHPPYKPVCLPCVHYWLYKSYKYMAGVACIGINIVTVSWLNSWKDGVHIYSIFTANYTCCAVSMLNTPCFKWGMCLSTPPLPDILYFSNDNDSRIRMDMWCVKPSVSINTKSNLCKSATKSTLLTHEQGWDSKDETKNFFFSGFHCALL